MNKMKKEMDVRRDDRGFSLVELIIVIAIMAILVGVMAPQLIKYIEKTNVAADTQTCDAIHSALVYAMMDPEVLTASDNSQQMIDALLDYSGGGPHRLNCYTGPWLTTAYAQAVTDILGYNPFDINWDDSALFKSSGGSGHSLGLMTVQNDEGTGFAVYLQWSDRTGQKQGVAYTGDYDGLEASKVIYVK